MNNRLKFMSQSQSKLNALGAILKTAGNPGDTTPKGGYDFKQELNMSKSFNMKTRNGQMSSNSARKSYGSFQKFKASSTFFDKSKTINLKDILSSS